MASMKIKCKKMPHGHTPMVTIQGKVYYFIASLEVEEGGTPQFASLYVHDPTLRDAARKNNLYLPRNTPKKEREICENILIQLQNELMQHNPYVLDILQMCQIPDEQLKEASFVITEKESLLMQVQGLTPAII